MLRRIDRWYVSYALICAVLAVPFALSGLWVGVGICLFLAGFWLVCAWVIG